MKSVWKTWKTKKSDPKADSPATVTPYTYDPFSSSPPTEGSFSQPPSATQPVFPEASDLRYEFETTGNRSSGMDPRLKGRSKPTANLFPAMDDMDAQYMAATHLSVPPPPPLRSTQSEGRVPTKSSYHNRPPPLTLSSSSKALLSPRSPSDTPRSQPGSPKVAAPPRSPLHPSMSPLTRFAPARNDNRAPAQYDLPYPPTSAFEHEQGKYMSASGRRMPELDGIWAGFLQEVEEDCASVASSLEERTIDPTLFSINKHLPPSRPTLPTSRSTPSLPRYNDSSRKGNEILLEFPPVPPLNVTNRDRSPKLTRSYTTSTTSTPPLSPASTCNQDVTPVATPVTPKFSRSAVAHIARQPSKDFACSPVGLYPGATSSSGSSFLSSESSRPATPSSPPRHRHAANGQEKPLRPARSCAQLRAAPSAKIHRATSSDSASDHSDASHSRSRGRKPATSNNVEAVLASNPNYLVSECLAY